MKKKQQTLVYVKRIQDNTKHFKKQTKKTTTEKFIWGVNVSNPKVSAAANARNWHAEPTLA